MADAVADKLVSLEARIAALENINNTRTAKIGPAFANFQHLTGLRGLWFPGDIDDVANMYDQSNQGRVLTVHGAAVASLHNNVVPYMIYSGAQWHSRADENGLDLIGNEANITTSLRGCTIGGWFQATAASGGQGLIGKRLAAVAGHSYLLEIGASGAIAFLVSGDGTNDITVSTSTFITANTWFWAVGRYTPSTQLKVWLNGDSFVNTTSIPATLFNSATGFALAAFNSTGVNLLTGRIALAFICASILPDAEITRLFSVTRSLFGV